MISDDEIKEIRNTVTKDARHICARDVTDLLDEVERLRAALAKSHEALEFYADEGHYEEDLDARNERIMTSLIKKDEGKCARQTLKEIDE